MSQMTMDDLLAAVTANGRGQSHAGGHDTERTAAASMAGVTGSMRTAVLHALADAGAAGLTDIELEALLGLQRPSGGNRRGDLCALGLATATGERRPSPSGRPCIVWTATGEGRAASAALRAREA